MGVFIQERCLFDIMAKRVGANLGRVLNRAQPLFEEKWDMTLVIKQMKHLTVDLHQNINDPAHH